MNQYLIYLTLIFPLAFPAISVANELKPGLRAGELIILKSSQKRRLAEQNNRTKIQVARIKKSTKLQENKQVSATAIQVAKINKSAKVKLSGMKKRRLFIIKKHVNIAQEVQE